MRPLPEVEFGVNLYGNRPELEALIPKAWAQLHTDFARAGVPLGFSQPTLSELVFALRAAHASNTNLRHLAYIVDLNESHIAASFSCESELDQYNILAEHLWRRVLEKVWFRAQFSGRN